ncbi:phosphomannomutase [Psychrobacter urativorans]|uniref:phosphomannomutase n=1 Tax=Psychrobacter urativorans TaxID=45610 RepID=A0A0M4SWL9_9GAMM|nr:phosphomannomutase [Psychrobacter urativorans]ALF59210.1 phosphomannomutase [Psychrobacter urativorans]
MTHFSAQQSLFRAYDVRGARQLFTSEFIQALGKSFAQLYQIQSCGIEDKRLKNTHIENHQPAPNRHSTPPARRNNTVVIGYDVRCNSDTIAHTLANILSSHALTVINLGLITTPMMAFWAEQYGGHGIMVTASHSEKNTLGVKWLVANASPSSQDIQNLYQKLLAIYDAKANYFQNSLSINTHSNNSSENNHGLKSSSQPLTISANRINHLPTTRVVGAYIEAIAEVFSCIHQHSNTRNSDTQITHGIQPLSKLNITIVIDCMHGATSNIAQALFQRFCRQVIMLNDTPDGNFPLGNPDPTEPNRLAELQQTVMIHEADMGLAFDGDGDRLMIVDNRGKVVAPDHLLYLLAQVAITERPLSADVDAPQVLFDVKCSHHLTKLLTSLGATPVMTRTGSSLLRQQLQARGAHAIFAGELSGHFIFNDGYFIVFDDAMYSGLRLLHWLTHSVSIGTIHQSIMNKQTELGSNTPNYSKPVTTTVDVWGEPKPVTAPYQLTDITQNLPMLVSTADHYLPLSSKVDSHCTIIEHLVAFCHYLQRLAHNDSSSTRLVAEVAPNTVAVNTVNTSSSCDYDHTLQYTTAQAQQLLPAGTRLSCIDGLRLDFDKGFGVLRKSNTSHSLTVRFAGDSVADLKDIQAHFVALCRPFYDTLAEQIAAIYPE